MASIYGVTIKNVKEWSGMEGVGTQANVYYSGKRVGMWTDDGYGGCCDYDFDTNIIKPAVEKYFKDWQKKYKGTTYEGLYGDDENMQHSFYDNFMSELANLYDMEKEYKKNAKKGYSVIVKWHVKLDPKYPEAKPYIHTEYFNGTATETVFKKLIADMNKKNSKDIVIKEINATPNFDIK